MRCQPLRFFKGGGKRKGEGGKKRNNMGDLGVGERDRKGVSDNKFMTTREHNIEQLQSIILRGNLW